MKKLFHFHWSIWFWKYWCLSKVIWNKVFILVNFMFLLWSVEFHCYSWADKITWGDSNICSRRCCSIMRCCYSLDKVGSSRGYQGRSVCCAGDRKKCCKGNGDTFGLATCLIRSSLRKMGYGRESLFVDKVLVAGLRQHKRYHGWGVVFCWQQCGSGQ